MSITYKDSGVDKEAGYQLVDKVKQVAKNTHNSNVLGGVGSFAALYALKDFKNPILVSGTDGVGTKLAVAFKQNRYDTVGIDCVAMCVNDILCHGATPLFFLDYLACGELNVQQAANLVAGVAAGCQQAGCALVGGETAEMPGFYKVGDYDIAGFAVGAVEADAVITGDKIKAGDKVIGIASSGLHSNGFSLVRKLFSDYSQTIEVNGKATTLGELLLTPTKIYVKPILALLNKVNVHGLAHITGGGLIENLPRVLADGLCAEIDGNAIPTQAIFELIENSGVARSEMWGTFNMGVGFTVVVDVADVEKTLALLKQQGENAFVIGEIKHNTSKKIIIN